MLLAINNIKLILYDFKYFSHDKTVYYHYFFNIKYSGTLQ